MRIEDGIEMRGVGGFLRDEGKRFIREILRLLAWRGREEGVKGGG